MESEIADSQPLHEHENQTETEDKDTDIEIVAVVTANSVQTRIFNEFTEIKSLKRQLQQCREVILKQRKEIDRLKEKCDEQACQLKEESRKLSRNRNEMDSLSEELAQENLQRSLSDKKSEKLLGFIQAVNQELVEAIDDAKRSRDECDIRDIQEYQQDLLLLKSKFRQSLDIDTALPQFRKWGLDQMTETVAKAKRLIKFLNGKHVKIIPCSVQIKRHCEIFDETKKTKTTKSLAKKSTPINCKVLSQKAAVKPPKKIKLAETPDICQLSKKGRVHFRDITKRDDGYYCVCRNEFTTRHSLDAHIRLYGSIYDTDLFPDDDEWLV